MPTTPPQYHERKLWQQNAFCEARGAPKQPFFAAEKWTDSRFAEVENGWIWLEPAVNELKSVAAKLRKKSRPIGTSLRLPASRGLNAALPFGPNLSRG